MESEREQIEITGNKKRKVEGEGGGGGRFHLDFPTCLKISKLLFPEKDMDSFEEGSSREGDERFAQKFGEAMSGSFSSLENLIEENSVERRESRRKRKIDKQREMAELLKKSVMEAFRESDPETARLLESKKKLQFLFEASGGLEDDSVSQYFKGEYWEADKLFDTDFHFHFEMDEDEDEEDEEDDEEYSKACVDIYFTLEVHQEREDGSDKVYFDEPEAREKRLYIGEYFKNRTGGRAILMKFMKTLLEKELGEGAFMEKGSILREFEDGLDEQHFAANEN